MAASLTRDVAAIFASAMKRVGLQYNVDCPPLAEDVYVDRETRRPADLPAALRAALGPLEVK